MKEYVGGFLFSQNRERVLLIRKKRPEWQAGRYNAIGGKIEPNESPLDAMNREFYEEAGLRDLDWEDFAILRGQTWVVYFFAAFSDLIYQAKTCTDELLSIQPIYGNNMRLPNLNVLIPIALDQSGIAKPVLMFDVTEPAEKNND